MLLVPAPSSFYSDLLQGGDRDRQPRWSPPGQRTLGVTEVLLPSWLWLFYSIAEGIQGDAMGRGGADKPRTNVSSGAFSSTLKC